MTLAARITRQPIAFDPAAAADLRAEPSGFAPEVMELLAATAGCSPYLRGLMLREADWLRAAVEPPEAALAATLAGRRCACRRGAALALRRPSGAWRCWRRFAIWAASGRWRQVTGALTRLADKAVHLALNHPGRRGNPPGQAARRHPRRCRDGGRHGRAGDGQDGGGGAELFLRHRPDLPFRRTRYPGRGLQEARAAFIKRHPRMTAMLSVTDRRLCLPHRSAAAPRCQRDAGLPVDGGGRGLLRGRGPHLGTRAYIKARPCGGDLAAGERFLKTLTPFVWRKHLDFAAIQDAHDMRLRIRDHQGPARADHGGGPQHEAGRRAASARSSSSPRPGS
jgi:glutamate-ammonia-ligase adenylyltransferase